MPEMPLELLLQHGAVTLVAAGAFGVLVRKVVGIFRKSPSNSAPACSNCTSGAKASPCGSSQPQIVTITRRTH